MLKSSPAIRQSSHALRTDISQMIAVYDHHLDGVGLASLRTKIEGPPDMKVGGRE
jgi:peptide deformylase